MKAHFARTLAILLGSNRDLTPEQRDFVRQWHRQQIDVIAMTVCQLMFPVSLVMIVITYAMAPWKRLVPQVGTHIAMSLMLWLWPRLRGRRRIDPTHYFYGLGLVCSVGYAYTMRTTLTGATTVEQTALWPFIMGGVSIFTVLFCPYFNYMVTVTLLIQLALGAWAASVNPLIIMPRWLISEAQILAFAAAAAYGRIYRTRQEALGELNSRTLMLELERLRVEAHERDLALARQMQDSFTPATQSLAWGSFEAQFYHLKYGVLGGDWAASRRTDDGLILVVADATGKGIAAGLVVHAIQSLWAFALLDAAFEPIRWINGVNRTLCELGSGSDHSMSMAIAVITEARVTYYSAGHVPLFLLQGSGPDERLKTVTGGGMPLGIAREIRIEPVTVDWSEAPCTALFLGTDGVFDRGTRTTRKAVRGLMEAVETQGSAGLASCPSEDDKLLVMVRRAA
jgi:hypothetical protein